MKQPEHNFLKGFAGGGSNDEATVWEEETADVKPLKGKKPPPSDDDWSLNDAVESFAELPGNVNQPSRKATVSAEKLQTFQELEAREATHLTQPQRGSEPFSISHSAGDKFSGERSSIDSKIRKKLAKGEIPYSSKLDLHGYVFGEAWEAIAGFLNGAQEQGHRCVLVIHGKGKGYGEGGNIGLIKSRICSWLQSHSAVLAYHTAQPKHGGSGAVYVLLRRLR